MGLPPGPPRNPLSKRGRVEEKRRAAAGSVEEPVVELTFPDPSRSVEEIWADIRDQLAAAGVRLQQVDAYAIEQAATAIASIRYVENMAKDAEDVKIALRATTTAMRLRADAMRFLHAICATPGARYRIVKPEAPQKHNAALDAVEDII